MCGSMGVWEFRIGRTPAAPTRPHPHTPKLLALLLLLFLSSPGRTGTVAQVRHQLEAQYAAISRAYRQKDVEGITRLMARDYLWKRAGMPALDRYEAEDTIRDWLDRLQTIKGLASRLQGVTVSGRTAIAIHTSTLLGTVKDQAGKSHSLVSTQTSRDTWIRTPEGWRIRRAVTLSSQALVDGHPVQPAPLPKGRRGERVKG